MARVGTVSDRCMIGAAWHVQHGVPPGRFSRWLLAFTFLLPIAGPVFADPSPTGQTPKLLWTPERQAVWNQLRATNDPWWQSLKSSADRSGTSSPRYADLGQWATMAYQVTGDPVYAQKAWVQLSGWLTTAAPPSDGRNFTREEFMEFVWMYDWLRPTLTSAQRTQFINTLNYWADLCLNQVPGVSWGTRLGDSDETVGHYFGLVFLGLATAGDNPKASQILNHVQVGGLTATGTNRTNMRNTISEYIQKRAVGGVWIESSEYNIGTLQLFLMGIDGVRTATGMDYFPDTQPFLRDLALAQMHEVTSDLTQSFPWGDLEKPRSFLIERRSLVVSMLAGIFEGDPTLGPYLQDFRNALPPYEARNRAFIFYNPYAPAANWRTFAGNGHYAPGMGLLYFHDRWDATGSLFGAHMASWPGVDHSVKYLGNFQLYRKGEWALTYPLGYDASQGEHVNAMLIAGLSSMEEARGPVAQEFGPNGAYAYVAGSTGGNACYEGYWNPPPRFLHEWTRSLFYLPSSDQKSDTIIVFDRVNADNPKTLSGFSQYSASDQARIQGAPALKQWILHTPVSPSIASGSISWQTAGGQTVRVDTLLPASQQRTVFDENQMSLGGYYNPGEKKFQVRIAPAMERRWDTFLNVILASSGAASITDMPIRSAGGEAAGALISRAAHDDALVMFNATQGPDLPPSRLVNGFLDMDPNLLATLKANRLLRAGYTVTWSSSAAATEVYLLDLDPAKQWAAVVDSALEQVLTVSANGVSRLRLAGPGFHSVILRIAGALSDTTPPAIAAIQVTNIAADNATIGWATNEPASGQVEYGLTSTYGMSTSVDVLLTTTHTVQLTGLAADTIYSYRVKSADASGNVSVSSNGTFRTAASVTPAAGTSAGSLPATLEAETMAVKTTGGAVAGGWNIWANGYIEDTVQFPNSGVYRFDVVAQGDYAGGAWPVMEVRIDQQAIGSTTVNANTWGTYTLSGNVAAGTHRVAIAFVNDYYNPPEDRNLLVDRLTILTDTPAPVNHPPTLAPIGPKSVAVGGQLAFGLSATDSDGDSLTYGATGLPSGATLTGANFAWTPGADQVGTYAVLFTVSDGNLTASETVTITVTNAILNAPPVVNTGPDQTITLPNGANVHGTITDDGLPSGSTVTSLWTTVSGPGTVTFGNASAVDTTAAFSSAGTYVLRLTASDGLASASDELTVTVAPAPQPASNLTLIATLEAETMATKTTGGAVQDGWNIWANGYLEDTVQFPSSGDHEFQIVARGEYGGGAWPTMELRIDQQVLARLTVATASWQAFTVSGYVSSGAHRVAIAFTNDYYSPPEDRNLLVDKIQISAFAALAPLSAPMVVEAETMLVKTAGSPVTGGWNISTNGYIEEAVSFPMAGQYAFRVVARGTSAGKQWPNMEVRIDQQVVGSVTVNSKDWKTFTITATVPTGTHRVAIAFTNDYYKSAKEDRNLYVDKVTIEAR